MRRSCLAFLGLFVVGLGWGGPSSSAGTFTISTREELLTLTAKLQAVQFLTHATFGPTEADINSLATRIRQIGTISAAAEWIDQQTSETLVKSLHLPTAEAMIAQDVALCSTVNSSNVPIATTSVQVPSRTRYRQFAWWNHAISGQDQLRQKTAWALSQILAVGNNFVNFNEEELEGSGVGPTGTLRKSRFLGLSSYYDIFVDNAFGSYRDVLQQVTYHGIMGDWLSHRSNAKADPANNRFPDENYAREVMQLFSIGLYMLNDDGTQVLDGNGVPLPTYDNDDIREYAKVFTGLGYNSSGGAWGTAGNTTGFSGTVRFSTPMTMASTQHETGAKVLLHGTLPALPATPTRAQCEADISAALDGLFNHQSCGPYVCKLLIQRFVKSNPSRAYMNRVVNVFKNNGQGKRGDIKAVVKAVLLDPEAWQPIRTQYLRNPNRIIVSTMGTEDSRLQEPVVNYTRILRGLKAKAYYEKGTTVLNTAQTGVTTTYDMVTPLSNEFRFNTRDPEFEQSPYESPSVFNFYLHEYQPSGEIAEFVPSSRIPFGEIAAPEFQIVNAVSANRTVNFFRTFIVSGSRSEQHFGAGTFVAGDSLANPPVPPSVRNPTSTNSANDVTSMLNPTRCRVVLDGAPGYASLATQAALARSMPNAPGGATALVEHLDLLFCQGTLNEQYRTKLIQILDAQRAAAGPDVDATEAINLARSALLCIVSSPSFLVSK
jgi:uncharacterized protein (DUF1800 family)